MKNNFILTLFILANYLAFAQTNISAVFSDYKGYWTSSTGNINPIQPDSSHNLLAFKVGSTIYSTGVNNTILNTHGINYVPQVFLRYARNRKWNRSIFWCRLKLWRSLQRNTCSNHDRKE